MNDVRLDLNAIRKRYAATRELCGTDAYERALQSADDVPMLCFEVERLRDALKTIAIHKQSLSNEIILAYDHKFRFSWFVRVGT